MPTRAFIISVNALARLETCRSGFADAGVGYEIVNRAESTCCDDER
jgi:hypothetical protein